MSKQQPTEQQQTGDKTGSGLHFHRNNYLLFFAGILLLVLGNILLSGGGSDDPAVFNPEIFNSQRLVVAPLTLLAGFVTIGFSIMWRFKK